MPFEIITEATLADIVSAVCRMVGHPSTNSPTSSPDPAIKQMITAANQSLGDLLGASEWTVLTREGVIEVVADAPGQKQKAFPLPEDFFRWIDQTQWSKQAQLPAMGPVSAQGWMSYTVRNWTPQLTLYWQVRGKQVFVLNPPYPTPVELVFQYISRASVIDEQDPTLLKNYFDKDGDTTIHDPYVITLLTRLKYLEYKGFDTTAATRDYANALDMRVNADKGAPVLSLTRQAVFPYISIANVPDTGYGRGSS